MELKKGMYVRTKKGIIRKWSEYDKLIKDWDDRYRYYDEDGDLTFVFEDEVAKYSNNIIDLIEFGDIVKTPKGKFEVGYVDNNVIYTLDSKIIACLRTDEHLCFENKIINSIITKEQFNSCKYVVERDK